MSQLYPLGSGGEDSVLRRSFSRSTPNRVATTSKVEPPSHPLLSENAEPESASAVVAVRFVAHGDKRTRPTPTAFTQLLFSKGYLCKRTTLHSQLSDLWLRANCVPILLPPIQIVRLNHWKWPVERWESERLSRCSAVWCGAVPSGLSSRGHGFKSHIEHPNF